MTITDRTSSIRLKTITKDTNVKYLHISWKTGRKKTSLHKLEKLTYAYYRIKMVKKYVENGQSQANQIEDHSDTMSYD